MSLDEEGFVAAEIRLGAFPGHQKVRSKSIKVCVAQGIACHPFNLFKMSLPFSFLIPFWYYLFQTIFNSVTWFLRPLCSTVVFFFPLLVIKAVSHSLSNNLSISEHSAVTWFIVCRGKKWTYSQISTSCTWPPCFRAGGGAANILSIEWKDKGSCSKGYISGKGTLSEMLWSCIIEQRTGTQVMKMNTNKNEKK